MELNLLNIFLTFLKIGSTSFGASTSEIIIEVLVEKKRWLTIDTTRECLSMSGLAPGPFHVNFVINLGYRLKGVPGMCTALIGFALPSFIVANLLWILFSMDNTMHFIKENPGIINGIVAGIAGFLVNAIFKLSKGVITSSYFVLYIAFLVLLMLLFKFSFFGIIIGSGILFIILNIFREKVLD